LLLGWQNPCRRKPGQESPSLEHPIVGVTGNTRPRGRGLVACFHARWDDTRLWLRLWASEPRAASSRPTCRRDRLGNRNARVEKDTRRTHRPSAVSSFLARWQNAGERQHGQPAPSMGCRALGAASVKNENHERILL